MKAFFSRRRFLIGFGLGTIFFLGAKGLQSPKLLAVFRSPWTFEKQLEQFYILSALLLEIPLEELDRELSDRIWKEIAQTDDALANLMDLSLRLTQQPGGSPLSSESWSQDNKLFAAKTLQIWYTGVVEDNQKIQKRLFYEKSYMYSFYWSQRPAPGNCAGSFGDWANPPGTTVSVPQKNREFKYV